MQISECGHWKTHVFGRIELNRGPLPRRVCDKTESIISYDVQGQTGYPWIDAIMIQLNNEGWIHCIARHAVACFLTRGDLWLSWEEGMKVVPVTARDNTRPSTIKCASDRFSGIRRVAAGRRLVGERGLVDVVFVFVVFPRVRPLLLSN